MSTPDTTETIQDLMPFEQLMPTGILWAINRYLFHPRGFALALAVDEHGKAFGWELLGKGDEVWAFKTEDDDQKFREFETFLLSKSQS
jgi:hypothetical protein